MSTGNLPRKHFDITELLFKAALNTNQSIKHSCYLKRFSVVLLILLYQDGLIQPADTALRDFCAKCLHEFLRWSIKQTGTKVIKQFVIQKSDFLNPFLRPASSVGSDAGYQSRSCEFESQLGHHSFRHLTKVTLTRVIRLSPMG